MFRGSICWILVRAWERNEALEFRDWRVVGFESENGGDAAWGPPADGKGTLGRTLWPWSQFVERQKSDLWCPARCRFWGSSLKTETDAAWGLPAHREGALGGSRKAQDSLSGVWERRADAGSLAQLSQGVEWEVGHIGDYRYQISQMTIRNHNIADKNQQRLLLPARLPLVRPVLPHRPRRHIGQNGGDSGLWYFRINKALKADPLHWIFLVVLR